MTTPRKPKKFSETAGASVDPAKGARTPLSDLVGQEVRVYGWEGARSSFGEYAILHLRRRGGEMEEVKTASASIVAQLRGMGEDDWPFEAYVLQAPAPEGMTGRLYFGDAPASTAEAPVGKRGN